MAQEIYQYNLRADAAVSIFQPNCVQPYLIVHVWTEFISSYEALNLLFRCIKITHSSN